MWEGKKKTKFEQFQKSGLRTFILSAIGVDSGFDINSEDSRASPSPQIVGLLCFLEIQ
jgi:hypothetical protein